jgi:hypothetical protein
MFGACKRVEDFHGGQRRRGYPDDFAEVAVSGKELATFLGSLVSPLIMRKQTQRSKLRQILIRLRRIQLNLPQNTRFTPRQKTRLQNIRNNLKPRPIHPQPTKST